jgi:hypothetical protein
MLTYITVTFSSEGKRPSEILDALRNLGFEPTKGNYDGIYKWDKNATLDDAIYLADKVHATLKGMNVLMKFETVSDRHVAQEEGSDPFE